jgi:hypothetical protein
VARVLRRGGLIVCALVALAVPSSAGAVGFSAPQFVDRELAGGEPLVIADPHHHTLVYTSHEGTTHLYRPGIFAPLPFGVNYRNQVNIWTSDDDGASWQRTGVGGASADPTKSAGFSDPDLTVDEGGRIYNTGIDLVNDSLFSSIDGGKTYDKGNPNCHDGDRPWLAGGKKDEVFLATNVQENTISHQIFQSTDGGNNCSTSGIPDQQVNADGSGYTGAGKIYYSKDRLIEPIQYLDKNGAVTGLGVGTWSRGDTAFKPHKIADTAMFAHWPAIAIDKADNVYAVWDDNPVDKTQQDSCGGDKPLPNNIKMSVSRDFGNSWSAPITVAHANGGRVFWPWIAAGDAGKVSVVWYQSSKVVDLDCEDSDITIGEAQILNALAPSPTIDAVNASKRTIHTGSVCQGGTLCVAENKDRRLGDFFTNSLDSRGCVLIASGDTTQTDPTTGMQFAYSLPIFMSQTSGQGLVGGTDCATGAPKPAPGSAGQCSDRSAPVTRLEPTGLRRTRTAVFLKGKASDSGCKATATKTKRKGRVESVLISVQKVLARHGCRFLKPNGRLEPRYHNCAKPIVYVAKGTTRWHIKLRVHNLPSGNYRAVARSVDASQNKERPTHRRNVIRFSVR